MRTGPAVPYDCKRYNQRNSTVDKVELRFFVRAGGAAGPGKSGDLHPGQGEREEVHRAGRADLRELERKTARLVDAPGDFHRDLETGRASSWVKILRAAGQRVEMCAAWPGRFARRLDVKRDHFHRRRLALVC